MPVIAFAACYVSVVSLSKDETFVIAAAVCSVACLCGRRTAASVDKVK